MAHNKLSHGLVAVLVAFLVLHATSYSPAVGNKPIVPSRRDFLSTQVPVAATFWTLGPYSASATDIKVTPLAHTFITASGSAKPIRENDATRYFTNARVVFLFTGDEISGPPLAAEVEELTRKRKLDRGPGVTPGNVERKTSFSNAEDIAKTVSTMPDGDVLLVGPIVSSGTAGDGKLLSEVAQKLSLKVGGSREGGVISVLLDGPRNGLMLEEGGYPASELLWYSI